MEKETTNIPQREYGVKQEKVGFEYKRSTFTDNPPRIFIPFQFYLFTFCFLFFQLGIAEEENATWRIKSKVKKVVVVAF